MEIREILYLIVSYLLGSIPAGYIVVYLSEKKDIRQQGSGNTGATNVWRSKGKLAAIITLVFDVAKGMIPVIYGLNHFPMPLLVIGGGAAAIIGHMFPVYLKFKGGKGIAPLVGVMIILHLPTAALFLATFLAVIVLTRYVSAGSLAGITVAFFYTLFRAPAEFSLLLFIIAILIVIKHRGNIDRLLAGNERKFRWHKHD